MQLSRYWYWSLIFGTASCVSLLFHDLRTQHFVSVTDFVTILYEAFITNVDILKCFVIKCDFSQCFALTANFGSLPDRFEQSTAEHDGIFTHGTSQEKPESVLLSQLHFKLSAKFKLVSMTSRLAAWPLTTCLKMTAGNAKFWASLETNFSSSYCFKLFIFWISTAHEQKTNFVTSSVMES